MFIKTPAVTAIVALLATVGHAYPHNSEEDVVEYLRAKVAARKAHNGAALAERQNSGGPEPFVNVPQTSISAATLIPGSTFAITSQAAAITPPPAPPASSSTSLNEADPDGGESEVPYTPPPPPPTSTLNQADPDGGEAPQTFYTAPPPAQTSDPTYTEALCGYTQYEFNTASELFTSWAVNLPYNPDWMDPLDQTTVDNDLKGSLGKSSACNTYSAFQSWVDQDNLRYEAMWITSIFCTAYDVTWVLGQTTANVYGNVACNPVEAESDDKPEFPDVEPGESIPEEVDVVKRNSNVGITKRYLKAFN